MKVILSERKKNPQGINSEGKKARIQSNDLEHKEEINIQPGQKEETSIQKNISTTMFIVALFTTANMWKQPQCPSVDEWIKQLWDTGRLPK